MNGQQTSPIVSFAKAIMGRVSLWSAMQSCFSLNLRISSVPIMRSNTYPQEAPDNLS